MGDFNTTGYEKGFIKNLETGSIKNFMYNPERIRYSRKTRYSEISSPGSSYPTFIYAGGESKEIPIELLLAGSSSEVESQIKFLEEFMPKEEFDWDYEPPPLMKVYLGSRKWTCIVDELDIEELRFDTELKPTLAYANLKLRVVG